MKFRRVSLKQDLQKEKGQKWLKKAMRNKINESVHLEEKRKSYRNSYKEKKGKSEYEI